MACKSRTRRIRWPGDWAPCWPITDAVAGWAVMAGPRSTPPLAGTTSPLKLRRCTAAWPDSLELVDPTRGADILVCRRLQADKNVCPTFLLASPFGRPTLNENVGRAVPDLHFQSSGKTRGCR